MSYPKSDKHIYALTVYDVPVRSFLFTTRMRLTAMELYRLAISSIRSNRRLAISVPDICCVCSYQSFPKHFTLDLYQAIIERFAHQYELYYSVENDLKDIILARALDTCYNYLSVNREYADVTSTILRFLQAFVYRSVEEYLSTRYEINFLSLLPDDYPRGEIYHQFLDDWQKQAIQRQFFTPAKTLVAWHNSLIRQFEKDLEELKQDPEYQKSHQEQLKRERIALIMSQYQTGTSSYFTILP